MVGPSSLDRIQGDDLFGPHIRERQWAARQGLLFETQEFDREMAILDCRADSIDVLCRVEDVLQLPVPQVAPRKCARALAEHLWGGMTPPFAQYFPSLTNADNGTCPEDPAVHRAILEEFAALDPENDPNPFSEQPQDAREILRRLNLVDGPTLSEEDDAALGRIADEANPAEQQRRSAR